MIKSHGKVTYCHGNSLLDFCGNPEYCHLCLCSLLHVNPVCSRFRHLHVAHGLSNPLAKLSSRLAVVLLVVS